MAERDLLTEQFEANRENLRAVAYRMLGSHAQAEDAVQEAWLRLSRAETSDVKNLAGWLTTVVARVSLDMLRSRMSRREKAIGEHLPDAVERGGEGGSPEYSVEMADALGPALLVVLDTLAPAERLAFVLHDLFGVPLDEIAVILDRSLDAARQLASRARRRVRDASPAQVATKPAAAKHLHDLAMLRRVRDRIDREYEQPLNVEALAHGVHMSAGHLSRQFRLAYGESPYSYLMTRRIERAMALLRRGDLGVTEVCFAVGCSSLGTFSTRFTELVGVPPSTYQRQAASATAGMPSCVAKRVTRPVRNREAPAPGADLG